MPKKYTITLTREVSFDVEALSQESAVRFVKGQAALTYGGDPDDWEHRSTKVAKVEPRKYTGCVVLIRKDDKVLAIERGPGDWNLPVGVKAEGEEGPLDTAIATVKRQTGLNLNPDQLFEITLLHTIHADATGGALVLYSYLGNPPPTDLITSPAGDAMWVKQELVLLDTCTHLAGASMLIQGYNA